MSASRFSLREWFARLRFVLFRRTHRDLDEELRFHVEQSIRAGIEAGLHPSAARRQALIEFGGLENVREETWRQRPSWLYETILQDVRFALRGFRRNPAFTLTVIATLALGIGATTAVFSVVDRILFRSLPYADDDRLVSVGLVQSLEKQEFMLGGFFYEWRDNQQPFSSLTFEQGTHDCNLTDVHPVHLQCGSISQNFLPTLGIAPVLGRNFLAEEDQPHGPAVAMISDGLWLSRFNRDPGILNKNISLDEHSVRIVGVLPRTFEMPRLQPVDIVLPAQMDVAAQHTLNSGIGLPMWAFARLKPGIGIDRARLQMQPLFLHTQQWIPAEIRNDFHLQVRSVRDRQMQDAYRAAWFLLGGVFAVLLIACANVASLFSARGAARGRELAVRSALGASRGRLVRQTMTEAWMLAMAGAVAGGVLAELLLHVFIAIGHAGLPFLAKARLDLRVIAFTIMISLVCALFFGILACLEKPRALSLAARAASSRSHARLWRMLVALQIAISAVLLSSSGLLIKSFAHLESQSLGMEPRNVLTVHVALNPEHYPKGFNDFYLRAEAALRQLPGVTAVGMSSSLPPDGWHDGMRYSEIFVVGQPPAQQGTGGSVTSRTVTPDYFRVLQIPIVRGAGFTEAERNSTGHLLVLSQLLASRLFPGEDPIGRHIQFGTFNPYFVADPTLFTVAGVAGNVKNAGLTAQDEPEFYTLGNNRDPQAWSLHHYFLLETALPASVVAPWIRARMAPLDSTAPVEIRSLSQDVNELGDRPRFATALLGFFAGCGLLMAVIGLYGVIAYVASQRTQEIGVRMALGATRLNILRLILREGVRMVSFGGLLGLAIALVLSRLMQSLLFQVSPHDPSIYVAVAVLLALVALAATLLPARSAMQVDPVEALRRE